MNRNLFGNKLYERVSVKLKLFCDEGGSKDWLYIGLLIVPEKIETILLRELLNKRCGNPDGNKIWGQCNPKCSRHKNNNTDVHYVEIEKSKDKYFVAERWIKYLLSDREKIYFYVLGLDLKKLDKSQFGNRRRQNNIYNRFFRTAILKSVKSYFHKYKSIAIEKIFHDNSRSLETDFYFPWHSIFYIDNKDDKVTFKSRKISFIDSDHRKSKNPYSNFIQLIDLLLGCINNCLDHTSKNRDKEALSMKSLPLVKRLIESPSNKNSRFNYVGRQKIEFFPKYDLRNLDEKSLEYQYKRMKAFYYHRAIKIEHKNQTLLPFID